MTAQSTDWPEELTWTPTGAELEQERQYWQAMDRAAELDAWTELQAQLESFEAWSTGDLVDELETLRTLTPDQTDVIEEIEAEIRRRRVVAA